jgi:hypothetical protein
MNENNDISVPQEEPKGNLVVSLKEIESFEGNIDISNLEAMVDEAFKGFHTISIEGQEKTYCKKERQAFLDEIQKLQKQMEEPDNEEND